MKIPYAISDLEKIRHNNFQYVDRTHRIPLVENAGEYDRPTLVFPGISSLESLLSVTSQTPHKLYLLIDEYDNFANELMACRKNDYFDMTDFDGFLKTFFKSLKSATGVKYPITRDMGFKAARELTRKKAGKITGR
jgi:hypothetical protein